MLISIVETCAKMAMEMNINFDDYKISSTTTDKNVFNYECTRCNKKTSDKIQLVYVRIFI
jgi:rRNA maturation endonuclease Nob1